jgi:endonuclease YncB( thermonuclease family)
MRLDDQWGMNPQAGWYQDPGKPIGHLRYWDGARWTEHESVSLGPTGASRVGGKPTAWIRKHKLVSALIAIVVLGWTINAAAGLDRNTDGGSVSDAGVTDRSDDDSNPQQGEDEGRSSKPASDSREKDGSNATPARQPHTYLVSRVIDGDTIELGNGSDVRIVGIDTPEVGQCGYDAATNNMTRLVLNEQVRLTVSDEDTDRYGRLLRYVNVGSLDAGLQQIKQGFAIARYDSRDGYGFHVREPSYIAADHASQGFTCPKPVSAPVSSDGGGGACAPGYHPCVPPFPPDVDCANVDGPIIVTGADPHGLDADGDGVACE